MSPPDDLMRLKQISRLLADKALRPVAKARADLRRGEERIAQIDAHRSKLTAGGTDLASTGEMLRQAERLNQLKARDLGRLAIATANLERATHQAARAVARDNVLAKLIERFRE